MFSTFNLETVRFWDIQIVRHLEFEPFRSLDIWPAHPWPRFQSCCLPFPTCLLLNVKWEGTCFFDCFLVWLLLCFFLFSFDCLLALPCLPFPHCEMRREVGDGWVRLQQDILLLKVYITYKMSGGAPVSCFLTKNVFNSRPDQLPAEGLSDTRCNLVVWPH